MFWDQAAGVYDIFVNVINRKTHKILKEIVSDLIEPDDVKRQFTVDSYRQFFLDAGYSDVQIMLADGRIPCAVAVMKKVDSI